MEVIRGENGDTGNAEFAVPWDPDPDMPLTLILFTDGELAS
jgi:hypothetical protein